MNWEAVGAVAELLGAIGVIASLVYLAGQIGQNTRQLKVTTTGAVADSDVELLKLLITDADLGRIVTSGLADRSALAADERGRFDSFIDMTMRLFQRNYYFAQDEAIKPALWESERESMSDLLCSPGGLAWWAESTTAQSFKGEFRQFLEGVIRESEAAAQQSAAADSAHDD